MKKRLKSFGIGLAINAGSVAMLKSKKLRKALNLSNNYEDLNNILQTVLGKFIKGGDSQ